MFTPPPPLPPLQPHTPRLGKDAPLRQYPGRLRRDVKVRHKGTVLALAAPTPRLPPFLIWTAEAPLPFLAGDWQETRDKEGSGVAGLHQAIADTLGVDLDSSAGSRLRLSFRCDGRGLCQNARHSADTLCNVTGSMVYVDFETAVREEQILSAAPASMFVGLGGGSVTIPAETLTLTVFELAAASLNCRVFDTALVYDCPNGCPDGRHYYGQTACGLTTGDVLAVASQEELAW